MTINFTPLPKQFLAYKYLTDQTTNTVLYGGSVGGGKSFLAAVFLVLSSLQYPGTRYLLGRSELKNLKQTTLNTFIDLCKEWGLEEHYNLNRVDNIITWNNGSEIVLKDLKSNPSDPDFVSLGSSEYTAVVVDECSEVTEKCFQVLKSRIRYKLNEYNLIPKMLLCTNPSKGWLYTTFYRPHIEHTLPVTHKFIQALPNDNIYLPQSYVDTLTPENLGLTYYNLLVLGNWDYANTDSDLFDTDALLNSFYQSSPLHNDTRYITVDPASTGKDTTVITVWIGYDCVKIIQLKKNDTNQIVSEIKTLIHSFNVRITNVIIDRIGVGTGVFDLLKGSVGFVANATALKAEAFKNQKAQMYYKFAELVNKNLIGIRETEHRTDIIQQLEAHKIFNTHLDGKAEVTPKQIVKQLINKSPDLADSLVMRSYFEYKKGSLPIWA